MVTAFLTTLEQMAQIFLFVALGFGLNRWKIFPNAVGAGMSRLVAVLFLPALMLYTNTTEFDLTNIVSYGRVVCLGALFWGVVAALAFPVAKKLAGGNDEEKNIYLYGFSFPNTGAVGLPLMLAFFGTAGVFQLNLFTFVCVLMTYVWGIGLFMDAGKKPSVRRTLVSACNPVSVAMALGLVLGALGAKNWLPPMILGAVGDLADCYVPIALLSVGYTVAEYPLGEVFIRSKGYLFSVVRLIGIPAFALAIAWLLGLEQMLATMVVLSFACPSGMNVVVFPAAYGRDCKAGASIVLLSSLGSILTVPLLYALVQYLFR